MMMMMIEMHRHYISVVCVLLGRVVT